MMITNKNFRSHNRIKEILEFAHNEKESIDDLFEIINACNFEELQEIILITKNLQQAIHKVEWIKQLNQSITTPEATITNVE